MKANINRLSLQILACTLITFAAAPASFGSIVGPYVPDANTIFLLHLDETSGGITTNGVPGSASFIATANPSAATPRNPLSGLLGATGASGVGFDFGLCADLSFSNSVGLFIDANGNGVADLDVNATVPADAISGSTFTGGSGEFTLEALVNLPSITGANREIISMDNSGGAGARPFQFRVNSTGRLEFNNIAVAGTLQTALIPTTGPEAFVANQWFHVALTYDGFGGLIFYWTRLDNARLGATVLSSVTVPTLNISGSAVLTVGNENRNTSGEGLLGRVDEVRISNIARSATDMAFDTSAPPIPPSINPQPTDEFLGVGETLLIVSHASGSTPLTYEWQKGAGGVFTNIAGQTGETLSVPVTFETEGDYRYIVSNAHGKATSSVARVTVGAIFSGLFPTGFGTNGVLLGDNEVDAHYKLWISADPALLGPNTFAPANVADYNANDTASRWIAPGTAIGGVRGVYTYRTTFLVDSATPIGSTLTASVLSGGSLTVYLNGQPTGIANLTPAFPGPHRIVFPFTITNGFVAGVNTLDFEVDNRTTAPNSPPGNALRVLSIRGVGPALPAGLSIVRQPQTQTVREGGRVTFEVVALGRPPLRYQWIGDDVEIPNATNRTLSYNPVTFVDQPLSFKVVVSNDSTTNTSQTANLNVTTENQPPVATNISLTGFSGAPVRLPISKLLQNASDPDGDSVLLSSFAPTGIHPTSPGQITQDGAALVYVNSSTFTGEDQFNVTLADSLGASVIITVTVQISELRLRIGPGQGGNLRLSWPAAATAQGFRLLSGDFVDAINTAVTASIATDATESAVQVTPTGAMRFFRLVYP